MIVRATCSALVLVTALFWLLPLAARADPGILIEFGAIGMNEPLKAGGRYPLPAVPVRNPGTSEGRYRVTITAIEGQSDLRPDPAWFSVEPRDFVLKPGEGQHLVLSLDLPWLLKPGVYSCLIQVGPVSQVQGAGLSVAAGVKLSFTVEHGNIASAVLSTALSELERRAPWSYLILGVIVLVLAYPLLQQLLGLNITIQRRG